MQRNVGQIVVAAAENVAVVDGTTGEIHGAVEHGIAPAYVGMEAESCLLALPDALLLEVAGSLSVQGLGRASCACRRMREICEDEDLWVSLWEGPLPGGFHTGGKTTHAALWLLIKGIPEQTRMAVSQPVGAARWRGGRVDNANSRRSRRRRVGEATGGSDGGGAGARRSVTMGGGFPVHVSCMAVSGRIIATATGPEIAVWDIEETVPRARFKVSGHGSITCLLLMSGILLAGDNSGYLRSYEVAASGRTLWSEIRAHADRVTAVDSIMLPPSTCDAAGCSRESTGLTTNYSLQASQSFSAAAPGRAGLFSSYRALSWLGHSDRVAAGPTAATAATAAPVMEAGGIQRRWDQGHGWGDGWVVAAGSASMSTVVAGTGGGVAGYDSRGGGDISLARLEGRGWVITGVGDDDDHVDGARVRDGRTVGVEMDQEKEKKERQQDGDDNGGEAEGEEEKGQEEEKWQFSASARAAIRRAAATGARARYSNLGGRLAGVESGAGSGKSRGRGRGVGVGTAGAGGGLDGGGGGKPALGEASWLGKRHGYAGRGASGYGGGSDGEEEKQLAGRWGSALDEATSQYQEDWRVGQEGGKGGPGNIVLFTGSDDGTAKAWDSATGRFLCVYAGHSRGVTCLQATHIQRYGDVLVTGGGDSSVIIWELTTGVCLEKLETGVGVAAHADGHGPRIGCLKALGDTIIIGEDRHIAVWKLAKDREPELKQRSFCKHQRPVRKVEVVGRCIITCSGDYVIRLWDSRTGLCVRELETKSGAAVTSFRLSGLSLLSTSLFDSSVLMTRFLPPPSPPPPPPPQEQLSRKKHDGQ